jgi:hypothetical protein
MSVFFIFVTPRTGWVLETQASRKRHACAARGDELREKRAEHQARLFPDRQSVGMWSRSEPSDLRNKVLLDAQLLAMLIRALLEKALRGCQG